MAAFSSIVALSLALNRPWVGIDLRVIDDTVLVQNWDGLRDGTLQSGDRVVAIQQSGNRIEIVPLDLIEEPDNVKTMTDMRALMEKSGRIHAMLEDGDATFVVQRDGQQFTVPASLGQQRPVTSLPLVFWIQIFVGLTAMLMGGCVLVMQPGGAAPIRLGLAGLGLMISSHAASTYSTRELAFPDQVFFWASSFNSLGSLTFGIGMIALFASYPKRYVPHWLEWGVGLLLVGWTAASFLRMFESLASMVHIPILIEMILIIVAAVGQVFATRGDPSARAALRWFGLSVTIGAGSFVALIAMPQAVGLSPQISQGYAFALFLIIYAGLAAGVARYKLFELEFWAFRALFYAGGVALLLILDAVLIYTVALDRLPAFSVSLLVVAFLYLPARDYLAQILTGRKVISTSNLFDLVSNAALAPGAIAQEGALRTLLDKLFQPLSIEYSPEPVEAPAILKNGEIMDVPGIEGSPDLRMHWAHRGRRLFSNRDLENVRAVMQMSAQVVERRRAYEAGAEEERQRINRDMHDHIGAQLLGALHSGSDVRKNALIRQTLTDLREIVSNPGGDPFPLQSLLGDLRAELSEHLSSVDIALHWSTGDLPDVDVAPIVVNSVRAILREGVSNILRHADASTAWIKVSVDRVSGQDWLNLSILDDGRGLNAPKNVIDPNAGNGLRNLATRLGARGGTFTAESRPGDEGTALNARLPLLLASDRMVPLQEAGE